MSPAPEHSLPAMDSDSPRPASRLIKFALSLVFYATAEAWRAMLRLAGKSAPPTVVVIYYHHVLSEHRERFARQLDHLLRWTMPLRGDQLESLAVNERYSVVTVDDGWKSFADNAVPELEHRHIPAAMFAISARLGASVDGIGFDRLVTPEELRALDAGTVTIGSHTATHAKMTALSASDAMLELRESRTQLGAILGHDVTMFCFPYGAYSEELIPLCREAGYQRVFTCMPTLASPAEFVQGRVRVDPSDWPLEFHLKLMGAYRWLPKAIALKRRILAMIRGGSSIGGASTSRMPAA
jgi:peptidoglycan/xylan/chitin deacetylase (PgdA/CDA1 family)